MNKGTKFIYLLVINNITTVKYGVSNASFLCSFRDNQSLYCLVCCSTDPTAPPNSSVYNISSTRGTVVTVDLDGLTSGQTYYCKAAASNNNSSPYNCTFPGFGEVNVFITFRAMLTPKNPPDTGDDLLEYMQTCNACVIIFFIYIVMPLPGMLCCYY